MLNRALFEIFKRGSRTFFYTSRSFPARIRGDVFTLYGFVRKADNFVDAIPQQATAFYAFRREFEAALVGHPARDLVISSFVELIRRKDLPLAWVRSFLDAMEMDITCHFYPNLEKLGRYMYGSAEVVGKMMARIMDLQSAAYPCARILGRAMQYINFLRDIREDLTLGRMYMPQSLLRKHGLLSLERQYVSRHRTAFAGFINCEVDRFMGWRKQAESGFRFIPVPYLISIKTASDMYHWTAQQIKQDPFIIYRRKVIPPIALIHDRMTINTNLLRP